MGSGKKHKKRSRHDSSSDSDDGDDLKQQLQREREAVTTLRMLLSTHPAVRKELREMLWTIDQGEAADVSGIPDAELKAAIKKLLKLLGLRKGRKDLYSLADKQYKTLQVLGFVFEEAPRPPPPVAASAAAAEGSGRGKEKKHKGEKGGGRGASKAEDDAAAVPAPAPAAEAVAEERDGKGGADGGTTDERAGGTEAGAAAAVTNGSPAAEASGRMAAPPEEAPEPAAAPAPRRVLGPAAPSAAMLAAAAAYMREQEDEDEGGGGGDDGGGFVVGPPPPELVSEMDAMPENEREAEVFRIMAVLRAAATRDPALHPLLAAAPAAAAGAPSEPTPDAYQVLGVDASATSGDVKKRYMRLSLLIHPDKCKHKDAHAAFQALSRAVKTLQDSGMRKALDEQLADAELRRLAVQAAAQQERERQWRVAKGLEDAGASAAAAAAAAAALLPQRREAWMTELPPDRVAPNKMEQTGLTARTFSQKGYKPRGDTSAWTDTPEQQAAKQARIAAAGPTVLAIGPAPSIGPSFPGAAAPPSLEASALDQFNSQYRRKTLVEEHQERMAKGGGAAGAPQKSKPAPTAAAKAIEEPAGKREEVEGSDSGSSSSGEEDGSGSSGGEGKGRGREGEGRKRRKGEKKEKGDKDKKKRKHKKKGKEKDKERERRKAGKKGKRDDAAAAAAAKVAKPAEKEAWEGDHPWRPFDRDKDLELKPKALNPAQLIQNAAIQNAGRFQSAGGTRHFL